MSEQAIETLFEEVSLEDGSGGTRGGDLLYAALSINGQEKMPC